jgi:hypothetical protein
MNNNNSSSKRFDYSKLAEECSKKERLDNLDETINESSRLNLSFKNHLQTPNNLKNQR